MSRRDPAVALRHMLDHAREVLSMAQGMSEVELVRNRQLSLAVVHLLEIVGEAATRVPREDQAKYPEIAWAQVVGLRNRLIHGYDAVDWDVVCQILNQDLPALVAALERIVQPSSGKDPESP